MKVVDFPITKKQVVTWGEAMQAMLDNANEETLNHPIRNLLIISEEKSDYSFGILNVNELRSMLGTIDCVKDYLISALHSVTTLQDE